MTNVAITKEAAAQRQIDAAIRMLFLHGEDLVAVHTLAAAARTVVLDLAKAAGVGREHDLRKGLEWSIRNAVSAAKQSLETGHPLAEMHAAILAWAAGSLQEDNKSVAGDKRTTINVRLEDLNPEHPKISEEIRRRARTIENDKRTVEYRNKAANFLKHADSKRDDPSLNLSDVDVFYVLAESLLFWQDLNLPMTEEMDAYFTWFCGLSPVSPETAIETALGPLHNLPFKQQIDLGRHLLENYIRAADRSIEHFRRGFPEENYPLPRGGWGRKYRPLD